MHLPTSSSPQVFSAIPAQRVVLLAIGLVVLKSLLIARLGEGPDPYFVALWTAPLFFVLLPILALRRIGDEIVPTLRLHPIEGGQLGWLGLLALCMLPAVWALGEWNLRVFPPPDELLLELEALVPHTTARAALAVVAVGIAVPAAEEVLFRGLVQQASRRMIGGVPAALTTGLLFALLHGQPWALTGLTLVGCLLGLVYEATGTLWAPFAVHATYNLSVLGLQSAFHQRDAPQLMAEPAGAFLAALCAWIGWAAYARLRPVRPWDHFEDTPITRP